MKLLALDTATETCTAALWQDGRVLERNEIGGQHAERLLPMVDALLAEAGLALTQLDALAFGRGPGSFTGLRIGAGVVQGMAFGADLPVVPVSSLAVLAQGVDSPKVLAAFDARMQQVYWGAYRRNAQGLMVLQGEEQVLSPECVPVPDDEGWVGAGPAWGAYLDGLQQRLGARLLAWHPQQRPQARHVAELGVDAYRRGAAVTAALALPVYLRNDVALKKMSR